MVETIDNLNWLQKWFAQNCNGDWEHNTNVKITNLDNPGWSLFINLSDTSLEEKCFKKIKSYRSDDDWVYCIVENQEFKSAGGALNLNEMLTIFRKWAES